MQELLTAASFFSDVVGAHTALMADQIGVLAGRTPGAEDFEPYTWNSVATGRQISASRYLAAIQWLQVWTRSSCNGGSMDSIFVDRNDRHTSSSAGMDSLDER
jgi:hypothetical protein